VCGASGSQADAQLHVVHSAETFKDSDKHDLQHSVIWGRGAIDMKSLLIAMLEALMHLHRSGYAPRRTLMLSIGHDEEVGGPNGARAVAALLVKRSTRLAVVLDEGMSVLSDGLGALVRTPVAMVGTAEKARTWLLSVCLNQASKYLCLSVHRPCLESCPGLGMPAHVTSALTFCSRNAGNEVCRGVQRSKSLWIQTVAMRLCLPQTDHTLRTSWRV
jgi:Peptidase family M20/M25/M40